MSDIQKYKPTAHSFYPDLSAMRAGLLFIVAGSLIYASQQGFVRDWFWWFTLCWGASLLIEVAIKLNYKRHRASITSPLVWGTILTGFSCYQLYDFEEWWPLALIVIGAGIILKSVYRDSA